MVTLLPCFLSWPVVRPPSGLPILLLALPQTPQLSLRLLFSPPRRPAPTHLPCKPLRVSPQASAPGQPQEPSFPSLYRPLCPGRSGAHGIVMAGVVVSPASPSSKQGRVDSWTGAQRLWTAEENGIPTSQKGTCCPPLIFRMGKGQASK